MGKTARRRRGLQSARRGAAVAAVLAAGLAGIWWQWSPQLAGLWTRGGIADDQMTQVDTEFAVAPVVRGDTFGNIPGDPMIIPRPAPDQLAAPRTVIAPEAMRLSGRADRAGAGRLRVIRADLRTPDRMLLAPLPSTREDFAMFQAERSRARQDAAVRGEADPASPPPDFAQPGAAGQAVVSNTVFLRPAGQRTPLWTDSVVETVSPRKIADLLAANGFAQPEADRVAARMDAALGVETVPPGSVLAVRHRGDGDGRRVIQLSLYGAKGFVGSLGMAGSGQLVSSADAWAGQTLLADLLSRDAPAEYRPERLMDMIYSAALRSGMAPDQVGAAIAMMAQLHDLDAFVDPSDRLTVIREEDTPAGPGALLFIGVSGAGGEKTCYVVRDTAGAGANGADRCFAAGTAASGPGAGPGAGLPPLQAPVAGALTQRFVPPGGQGRGGPLRGHVVWSAAQGAPVHAAAGGVVTAMRNDPAAGAIVEITHQAGAVSVYRGLGAVAPGLAQGAPVASGAQIGVIGVPPGQAQPGLVFQLIVAGQPVDPGPLLGGAVAAEGSGAVEALIGRIIRVESGGNARARNPLSTASGLGQFIESTWLRMMRSYRPDLTASLSRGELLDLRFDAGLSREMVRRLAQENEAYLKARGHTITAGRLYLAHFLGPGGADMALRADPARSVIEVMGPGVVAANPFLRGRTIADLRNWADRKMGGAAPVGPGDAGGAGSVPAAPMSPEVRQFIALMDQIRGSG